MFNVDLSRSILVPSASVNGSIIAPSTSSKKRSREEGTSISSHKRLQVPRGTEADLREGVDIVLGEEAPSSTARYSTSDMHEVQRSIEERERTVRDTARKRDLLNEQIMTEEELCSKLKVTDLPVYIMEPINI